MREKGYMGRCIRGLFLGLAILALAGAGCSGKKATELMETARFEELQNNKAHAVKLYEEIVKKYPGSVEAKEASERLAALKASGNGPAQ